MRVPGGDGQRWGRSLYLDGTAREYRVPFLTMLPLGLVDDARPPLGERHGGAAGRGHGARAAGELPAAITLAAVAAGALSLAAGR